jgi:uncharacterized membrane protein YidH (DUF202 family)
MNASAQNFVSPQNIIPEPNLPAKRRGRIYVSLPKMWVGIGLACICLAFQLIDPMGMGPVLLVSVIGTCYWMFCVHRLHRVLADYTLKTYGISPRRAVGFQFIPIFGYVWSFRWTRQMATFLEQESPGFVMPKIWPGALLVTASVFGIFAPFKAIRLFLIFGFGIYLVRKLKLVLPACRPYSPKWWQQCSLSMSAGIGAAFSFVLFQAVRHFTRENGTEKLHDLAAIFLVSIGVLIFLEPVFEQLRIVLGISEHHPTLQSRKPLLLRLGVFLILVVTSLFHGLLHSELEWAVKTDIYGTAAMLLAALLGSGGVTYFWIGGAHHRPPQAAQSGLISGMLLGLLVAFGLFLARNPRTTAGAEQSTQQKVVHLAVPWVPGRIIDDVGKGDAGSRARIAEILTVALPWAAFGFVGGMAIDKRWRKGKASGVALSIFVGAIISGIALRLTGRISSVTEVLSNLSAVIGWGLALVVCSSSRVLIPEVETAAQLELVP